MKLVRFGAGSHWLEVSVAGLGSRECDSGSHVLNHCSRAESPLREASPHGIRAAGLSLGRKGGKNDY